MRGLIVFCVFFIIFLASTLAIPSPLYPGSLISGLLKIADVNQASLASAIANGAFYGGIAWIVFSLTRKWIENNLAKNKLARSG
jgi:hypothetical protein